MKRLLAVALLSALALFAQSERGNITGLVTDATGAPVGSARVNVTKNDTNTATHVVTTSTGEYNVPNLTPGTYRVEVTAPGFKTFLVDRLTLTAGATVRTDAQLQVGQLSESVEVTAQAIQMQTEDAKISSAVQNRLVDELLLVVGGAPAESIRSSNDCPRSKRQRQRSFARRRTSRELRGAAASTRTPISFSTQQLSRRSQPIYLATQPATIRLGAHFPASTRT